MESYWEMTGKGDIMWNVAIHGTFNQLVWWNSVSKAGIVCQWVPPSF